jgi:hypothetical protein
LEAWEGGVGLWDLKKYIYFRLGMCLELAKKGSIHLMKK